MKNLKRRRTSLLVSACAVALAAGPLAGLATAATPPHSLRLATPDIKETNLPDKAVPQGVAVTPQDATAAKGHVWVADKGNNQLLEMDPANLSKPVNTIALSGTPRSVLATKDAVWVTMPEKNSLAKIPLDAPDKKQELDLTTVDTLKDLPKQDATGLATDASGTVWVTLQAGHALLTIDPKQDLTAKSVTLADKLAAGTGPVQITQGPDNRMWFTEYGSEKHAVGAFDPTSKKLTEYTVPDLDGGLYGIAAAGDKLWVTEYLTGMVTSINSKDGSIGAATPLQPSAAPRSIVAGPDGASLWVDESGTGAIAELDASTGALKGETKTPTADSKPYAMALDPQTHTLWATESGTGKLASFTQFTASQLYATTGDGGYALPGKTFAPKLGVHAATSKGADADRVTVTFRVDGSAAAFSDGQGHSVPQVETTTDKDGNATIPQDLVASDSVKNATFTVTATAPGAKPVVFHESIGEAATSFEAKSSIDAYTHTSEVFDSAPLTQLKGTDGAMPNVPVTYTITSDAKGGATGTFQDGSTQAVIRTDAKGQAQAPRVNAGEQKGDFTITATSPASASKVAFHYHVTGAPAKWTVTPDQDTQMVDSDTKVGAQGILTDKDGKPVAGERVTFSIDARPGSAKATFEDGSMQTVVVTDANGRAFIDPSGKNPIHVNSGASGSFHVTATPDDHQAPSYTFNFDIQSNLHHGRR